MKHAYSVSVIQDRYIRRDGTAQLRLQAVINREAIRLSLNLHCRPEEFDPRKPEIRKLNGHDPNDANLILGQALARANTIFVEYRLANIPLTKERFIREFDNPDLRKDLITYMEQQAEDLKGVHSPGTIVTYHTAIKHLKSWMPIVSFLDLTQDWAEEWDNWMKKCRLSRNNRWKQHKIIKKFIRKAIKSGIKCINPYDHFQLSPHYNERVFLTRQEVRRLLVLYRQHKLDGRLQETLCRFIFSISTGARYSDLNNISKGDLDGKKWFLMPQKTQSSMKVVPVPLIKRAREMRDDPAGHVYKKMYRDYFNSNLEIICHYARIKKKVTSHTGRHTFAVLFLEAGGRVETLRLLLGHSKIDTTMVYVHLTDQRRDREMNNMDDLL